MRTRPYPKVFIIAQTGNCLIKLDRDDVIALREAIDALLANLSRLGRRDRTPEVLALERWYQQLYESLKHENWELVKPREASDAR